MDFSVLTIFPDMIDSCLQFGIINRAVKKNQISVSSINIRDFARGRHRVTDDRPYGGGPGMVMKPDPLAGAIDYARKMTPDSRIILLTPQGRRFDREMARRMACEKGLTLICGRYEGIDERVRLEMVDDEVSIGDYVLTGGELAAMIIIDAVTRFIPGILGAEDGADKDSFEDGMLEHAHYSRPRDFQGSLVPDVLLSGNHKEIDKWRLESSLVRTMLKRPDLLEKKKLDRSELDILRKWCRNIENIIQAQDICGLDSLPGEQ